MHKCTQVQETKFPVVATWVIRLDLLLVMDRGKVLKVESTMNCYLLVDYFLVYMKLNSNGRRTCVLFIDLIYIQGRIVLITVLESEPAYSA